MSGRLITIITYVNSTKRVVQSYIYRENLYVQRKIITTLSQRDYRGVNI